MSDKPFQLNVNGMLHDVDAPDRKTLGEALREDCGLTGTHLGCEHGVCGTCTVLVDGKPVRGCLMFARQAEGAEILTVEGLAKDGVLHPLQQAFIDNHALQCGFCTPGFLMLIVGALRQDPDMSAEELEEVISSNLCRCTGYAAIVRSALDVFRPSERPASD